MLSFKKYHRYGQQNGGDQYVELMNLWIVCVAITQYSVDVILKWSWIILIYTISNMTECIFHKIPFIPLHDSCHINIVIGDKFQC